jgi:uncharacterized membrane protein
MGSRESDIARLYRAKDWAEASAILQKYHVRYLYVGQTERRDFNPEIEFFTAHMPVVFQMNGVTIFEFQTTDSQ